MVIVDQVTKAWALSALSDIRTIEIWGDFLAFTLVFNQGGALGTSLGSSTYYLISGILILGFLLFYIYHSRKQTALSYSLAFVAGGAIGNLIDRWRFDHVVDFIDIDIIDIDLFGYHLERWWTFNIADAAISCSIVFLIVHVLFFGQKEEATESDDLNTAPPDIQ